MGVKPKNATPGQPVTRGGKKAGRQPVHVAGHPQRIRRRLAASHMLADGFLQIDNGARLIHANKLTPHTAGGERLFQYPPAASLKT